MVVFGVDFEYSNHGINIMFYGTEFVKKSAHDRPITSFELFTPSKNE
jgi:hypothetical protein